MRWDIRSDRRSIFSMIRRAGRARPAAVASDTFEPLENRVLLAGDEPGFAQVFNTPNPATPPLITLDATGTGSSVTGQGSSVISPSGDDDMFRFTAPANDFVRIWADCVTSRSPLDSRVEVYIGTPGGGATLVTSGSTQGVLTAGTFTDGWVGFKAIQGQEYFVRVLSDQLSGTAATGTYTLRINARSLAFPTPSTGNGVGSVSGTLTIAGGDVVYRLVLPSAAGFKGLMTMQAEANAADLDPRLDVYDVNGNLITGDSDSGNLTDSYLVVTSLPNAVYYVRLRSDEFGDPATRPSTGAFTLVVDGIPDDVAIDPVTRLSDVLGGSLADQKSLTFFSFTAQGTGLTIISLWPAGLPPVPDSFLHIYNDQGVQIGTNELPGGSSQLLIPLIGGNRYFVVVEDFNATSGGGFAFQVEAHHTFDTQTMNPPIDDHVNTPAANADPSVWDEATPIVWSAPRDAPVPAGLEGLAPPIPDPSADHVKVELGVAQGRVFGGGDTDLFQFVPPVDMLADWAGQQDPTTYLPTPVNAALGWLPNFRPSSRLQVTGFGTDGFMVTPRFKIYDSNHNVVFSSTEVIPGTFVYGGLDPATMPPTLPIPVYGYTFGAGQPSGIKVWGGEVYYLEVSSDFTGRYQFTLQVDAPTDTHSDMNPAVPAAGNFANAYQLQLDPNTGDGRNYNNVAAGQLIDVAAPTYFAVSGNGTPILQGRGYAANVTRPVPPPPTNPPPGTGATVSNLVGSPGTRGYLLLQMSDFGNLTSVLDTDLYQFRAVFTGTAEIRLNTTGIQDEFWNASVLSYVYSSNPTNTTLLEPIPMVPDYVETVHPAQTKTLSSPLDGALRIFDNDQTQIAYNNDNSVTAGESETTTVGQFSRTFQRRDPRVVINVEAGKTYYVQVESGQRSNFSLTYPKVDWRHAIGKYELLVNAMPNLNLDDDHINAGQGAATLQQATPLKTDLSVTSPTGIVGQADGVIQNTFANPNDTDVFTFMSPAGGAAKFTLSTRAGDSFARIFSIFDSNGVLLVSTRGTGTDDIDISVAANQGDRFYAVVDGDEAAGGSFQGRYTVKVSGVPFIDDFASEDSFVDAHVIPKDTYDYDRTESVNGTIESAGDTDIFTFDSLTFDMATISVHGAPGFFPKIRVYEISVDPVGNPIRLLIANNGPATSGSSDASTTFSVTAPPRTHGTDSYPSYFVVVGGLDPNRDKGAYTLTLSLNIGTDDHPDGPNPPPPGQPIVPGQWDLATVITPGPTGNGGSSGVIELEGDTDLFTFTVPAAGQVTVSLVSPTSSHLLPRLRIIDSSHNAVTDLTTNQIFVTGGDQANSVANYTFNAGHGDTFFIMVEGVSGGTQFKTDDTGAYFVTLTVPEPDDHPNAGEFPIADDIPLSPYSGSGSAVGLISPNVDTDLFKFTAILDGNMVVSVSTPGSNMTPVLQLFAPDQSEIGTAVADGGPGDDDGQANGTVVRHFAIQAGQTYYVLVSSDQNASPLTGSYLVTLAGPTPNVGADDLPDAGQYSQAVQVPLDQVTGDGSRVGHIEIPTDTDLVYFVSLAGSQNQPVPAFIQVVTPTGQALDVGVRIIRQDQTTVVASDTAGGPGYNAGVQFGIDAAGERYYIEVDGLGGTGVYTIRIDTSPEAFVLYYPDGKSSDLVREYVSIGNANNFDVDYTITLRFEDTAIAPIQFTGTVAAGRRGGITLSDGNPATPAIVPPNKPYTMTIDSNGFLGANVSHYESGDSYGEAFASHSSTTWTFAKAEKFHGAVDDKLVTFNPNANAATVTLTAYRPDGTSVQIVKTVPGLGRLTWDFDDTVNFPTLPVGQFAVSLSSDLAIVAALNHKDLANTVGYAVLGDSGGGSTTGVIPGLVDSGSLTPAQKSEITLYNSSDTATIVHIVGKYLNTSIADLIFNQPLGPRQSITLTGQQLRMVANQTVGLRYDSNVPITVLESTKRFGDADATQAQSQAGTSWFFGDAFINRLKAGQLYFENMYFYNPNSADIQVQLSFIFASGTPQATYTLNVGAGNYATVALHQLATILNHAVLNYFAIQATSSGPFVVSMTHYDLVLAGGWGSEGAPLGLTNPINTIT